ncbi:MAG: hypothetical protein E2P06_01635 [Acidobacteria bacterium]|nr:MAG: hypothetical protein E2P06_01635 [Acidobacteriota bacterium]
MRRRWGRIAVVVVTLATLGFTGYQIRLSELALDDEQNVERVFTDLSWALTLTIGDLRAAQQAYVAAGQDRRYWTAKVNSHLDTVRNSLDNLRRLATNPESIEALDSADGAVADLERMDGLVREQVDLEQLLMASDLIFTDGLELAARVAANVELARATERTTRNETIRATRSSQAMTVLFAAGVSALAVVVLLVPMKREEGPAPFASIDAEKTEAFRAGVSGLSVDNRTMLDNLDLDIADPSPTDEAASRSTGAPDTTPTPAADSPEPVPDLRIAADLCTDLCRLTDTSELPALLARAAALMNASGIIIWVRDSSGHALRPAIGYGYPTQTLARLGSIPEDGDNATSVAYRSARMQVVERDDTTSGALAAPLLGANCCVGVLSAELREGWESSTAVQATVAIMAAQLATLLSADPPAETAAPPAEAHG